MNRQLPSFSLTIFQCPFFLKPLRELRLPFEERKKSTQRFFAFLLCRQSLPLLTMDSCKFRQVRQAMSLILKSTSVSTFKQPYCSKNLRLVERFLNATNEQIANAGLSAKTKSCQSVVNDLKNKNIMFSRLKFTCQSN